MNRASKDQVRDVSARVSEWLLRAYPAYPGTVAPSADDPFVLCVRVFAVPADMAGQVQDAILDLQDRMLPGMDIMLLPMVKNLDVTREYYPEYLPVEVPQEAAMLARLPSGLA